MRSNLLLRLAAAFLLLAATLPAAERLNVLLILSDDLRDTVGCYGNAAVKTPNLDRLAARAVRFDRAYAQYPVCNPSRTSFLTGLRCEQTGVVNNNTMFRDVLPNVVTLPQLLRQQGWYAAGYGKVFHLNGRTPEQQALSQDHPKSFDEAAAFRQTPAGRITEGRNLSGGKLEWCHWGMTAGADDDQPDGQNRRPRHRHHGEVHRAGQTLAGRRRVPSPARSLHLAPRSISTSTRPARSSSTTTPPTSPSCRRSPCRAAPSPQAFNAFTDKERMEFLRAYYAGVSFMDAQVGRLLDTLDRLKLWDSTLIIFSGDNGYHHNERNWWNKNTLFERSCRVPLIVAAPGAARGQVCRAPVELVDLYPTVADYCQLQAPHTLAGQSLRPLLTDPARKGRDAAFTLVVRGGGQYGQAVRTDRWRYIRWSDGTHELYDEANDPDEVHDVASDPRHAALIQEMLSRLKKVGPFQSAAAGAPRKAKRTSKAGS